MSDFQAVRLCECGCGQPTRVARWTKKEYGHVKGQPLRFIHHHNARVMQAQHPTCKVEGCDRLTRTWGYCLKHYTRVKRHGDPLGKYPRESAIIRFWMNVERTDECWLWKPSVARGVYGKLQRDDGIQVGAHRFSYELHQGPIATGLHVLHRCDNPPCVNPDHLFLGTREENMQDMLSKGRGRPGGRRYVPGGAA